MLLVDVLNEFPEFRGDIIDREFLQLNHNLRVGFALPYSGYLSTERILVLVVSLGNIQRWRRQLSTL